MLSKTDLERLAQVRLDDAILLLRMNRSSSAYYLSGYAVELGLKACIANLIHAQIIPEKAFINALYTHKLDNLLATAGLLPQFQAASKADPELATHWAIASKWSEDSRYQFWDPVTAATMLSAIVEPEHGVFQWVKRQW